MERRRFPHPPVDRIDDIVVLGSEPDIIEAVSPRLARFGVLAIIADEPMRRKVRLDVGRIHYDRHLYVGGPSVLSSMPNELGSSR